MWRSRRRGHYDYIPGLEGLSDERQRALYKQARRETGWSWQLVSLQLAWFACFFAMMGLIDVLYGSRWNPGIPRPLIVGLLAGFFAYLWAPLWRWYDLNVVAPRIWRRLPGICNACGYDLTGNESGRCPECGFEISAATEVQSTAWKIRLIALRFRNPFRFTDLIVLIVIIWLVFSAAMLISAL